MVQPENFPFSMLFPSIYVTVETYLATALRTCTWSTCPSSAMQRSVCAMKMSQPAGVTAMIGYFLRCFESSFASCLDVSAWHVKPLDVRVCTLVECVVFLTASARSHFRRGTPFDLGRPFCHLKENSVHLDRCTCVVYFITPHFSIRRCARGSRASDVLVGASVWSYTM